MCMGGKVARKKKKDPLYLCNCHSPMAKRQTSRHRFWECQWWGDNPKVSIRAQGNCSIQNTYVNSWMYWLVNHRQLWFLYWASELCEYRANPEECTKYKRSEIPSQLCSGYREWQAWKDLSETSSTAFCRGISRSPCGKDATLTVLSSLGGGSSTWTWWHCSGAFSPPWALGSSAPTEWLAK